MAECTERKGNKWKEGERERKRWKPDVKYESLQFSVYQQFFFIFFFKQHEIGLIWHSLGAGLPLSLTFVERGDEGMKLWKTRFRLICIERARFLIGCIHKIFAYRVATQATQVWDESRSRSSAPRLSPHSNVIPHFLRYPNSIHISNAQI